MMEAPSPGPAFARRAMVTLVGLVVVLVGVSILRMCVGQTFGWPDRHDILVIRGNHLMTALVVGTALATSGVGLQALLRNPLAEPFILGLSTGAGVGIVAQSLIVRNFGLDAQPAHVGALVGAILSMAIVFFAAHRGGIIDRVGLLLTGIVLSTINGALIMLINYLNGPGGLQNNIASWMMGNFMEVDKLWHFWAVAGVTVVGLGIFLCLGRAMDAASFSSAESISLGVPLRNLRATLFIVAGTLAAGSVVLAGPIAFVGLISPHMARLLLGPIHRWVLLGSAVIGAALLVLANSASEVVDMYYETGILPVGIFIALLGGPMFLWILRPYLGRHEGT